MDFSNLIQTVAIYALPVLFAITVHEAAHGYVARHYGDNTAAMLGRITLNPVKHIDPIGTILMPVLLYFATAGHFLFGYAKPVPVNFGRLRNPKRDMIWVALAGPASNFIQAVLWAVVFVLLMAFGVRERFFLEMANAGIKVNLVMWAFNLFPLPPLDGGRVLVGLLPYRQAELVSRVEPWGFFIVMGLVIAGVVSTWWLQPLMAVGSMLVNLLVSPLILLTRRAFPMATLRVLTGITTSGTPHLGNYVGAIRPAVAASRQPDVESFYFLADFHALIKVGEPERVQRSTLEIAATWLAAGLDPERVFFYRQSDIPEIPELTWLLTCVTGKGLLNRAHAYKAAVDKNLAAGSDPDADVNAGLFMYPVLMAADILMFKAHQVPVGRDQVQHLEMARDMAASFNHLYGEHFVAPAAVIDEAVATLPGLDGRKMSKSYDNTIPLFAPREQLRRLIMGIVTDSRAPGEPKPTEGSALFQIYQAFADADETEALRRAYAEGIAWGDAKQHLFERIDREVAPMRAHYEALVAEPSRIESTLLAGAEKARSLAMPFLRELRHAVGLRNLSSLQAAGRKDRARTVLPSFKQYRETDGQFYFKLVDAHGGTLLQSVGFAQPRDAGQAIAQLQRAGAAGLAAARAHLQPLDGVSEAEAAAALDLLRAAVEKDAS